MDNPCASGCQRWHVHLYPRVGQTRSVLRFFLFSIPRPHELTSTTNGDPYRLSRTIRCPFFYRIRQEHGQSVPTTGNRACERVPNLRGDIPAGRATSCDAQIVGVSHLAMICPTDDHLGLCQLWRRPCDLQRKQGRQ